VWRIAGRSTDPETHFRSCGLTKASQGAGQVAPVEARGPCRRPSLRHCPPRHRFRT
jgi:hypothetical protein